MIRAGAHSLLIFVPVARRRCCCSRFLRHPSERAWTSPSPGGTDDGSEPSSLGHEGRISRVEGIIEQIDHGSTASTSGSTSTTSRSTSGSIRTTSRSINVRSASPADQSTARSAEPADQSTVRSAEPADQSTVRSAEPVVSLDRRYPVDQPPGTRHAHPVETARITTAAGGKLDMMSAGFGSPFGWHQDYAASAKNNKSFYPGCTGYVDRRLPRRLSYLKLRSLHGQRAPFSRAFQPVRLNSDLSWRMTS